MIERHDDIRTLCRANRLGLKDHPYDEMQIVDSDLRLYKIAGATVIGGRGPFRGYNLFFNRNLWVELHFEPGTWTVTLDEVKSMFTERLTHEDVADFFTLDGDVEHYFNRLSAASTFEELADLALRVTGLW